MRIWLFILLFSTAFLAMAQQETYTQIYSGASYDEGIAAFRLPNKEIRIIGNTGSYGHGNTDIWLIALDSNAGFLWHKFYGGAQIEKAESAVMNSKGDIFIVGSTTQNTAASYQVYFLALDQYGQIIGYNNYGGSGWDFGKGICLVNDTSFALVGESFSSGNGQGDVFVLRVNQYGDTLWTKTYGGPAEDYGNSIKLSPDEGFIIAGASKSFGNGSLDSYILRLNSLGDTLWTRSIAHITDAEFMDVVLNPDTSFTFCGYRKDALDTYRDINLEKYDKNANFQWSRFSTLSEGKDSYAKSMIREDNGRYTFCGITTKFAHSKYSDARIVRTIPSGWWQASTSLGDLKQDVGNFISLDNFHGKHYFMVGTTKSYDISMSALYFVRLDSNLNTDTTRNLIFPTNVELGLKPISLKTYPNPAKDILYIEYPLETKIISVQIYDIQGREFKVSWNIEMNGKMAISTQILPKGVYFMGLQTSTHTYTVRFIKG